MATKKKASKKSARKAPKKAPAKAPKKAPQKRVEPAKPAPKAKGGKKVEKPAKAPKKAAPKAPPPRTKTKTSAPRSRTPASSTRKAPVKAQARKTRQARIDDPPARAQARKSAPEKVNRRERRERESEEVHRIFPDRDGRGRWRHPTTGNVISEAEAKRSIRRAERSLIVKNAARATRMSEAEVRRALKGIKTADLVGKYAGRKPDGSQRRGEWVTKKVDTRKTILVSDRRKGAPEGKMRRVPNPNHGKPIRVFREGATKKGAKALRRLGIVNADGLLVY